MEAWPNAPGDPSKVATLPLVFNTIPGGSPVAVILNVSEQVLANVTTTLVILSKTSTVCDCGPEVSVPEIVQEDEILELADADNTVITPVTVAEAVASLVGANIASIE